MSLFRVLTNQDEPIQEEDFGLFFMSNILQRIRNSCSCIVELCFSHGCLKSRANCVSNRLLESREVHGDF